jgi:hypothetical protein
MENACDPSFKLTRDTAHLKSLLDEFSDQAVHWGCLSEILKEVISLAFGISARTNC